MKFYVHYAHLILRELGGVPFKAGGEPEAWGRETVGPNTPSKGGWSLGVTSAHTGLEASPLASDLASSAPGPESLEEEGRGLGWAQFSQLPQPLCTREAASDLAGREGLGVTAGAIAGQRG